MFVILGLLSLSFYIITLGRDFSNPTTTTRNKVGPKVGEC